MKRSVTMIFFCALICAPSVPARPAPLADPFPAYLMANGIEAFSAASSRGDQAAMGRLVDDKVLFSSGDGAIARDPKLDANDAVARTLRRQTQAFRNASQLGNSADMNALLDPHALFIDENGTVSGAGDRRLGELASPMRGIAATIATSDFVVRESGASAVASFVDTRLEQLGDQTRVGRFLAVETWIRQQTAWKLLASQVIPLYGDPAIAPLAPEQLAQYAGTYSAGAAYTVTISQTATGLVTSTNGAPGIPLRPEALDVFFTAGAVPGAARSRSVFQRNAAGEITGYVSRAGLVLGKTSAPESPAGAPANAVTSSIAPAADLIVRRSGDVAVATFIHDRTTHVYEQTLHTKYRSTETWIKRGSAWKMLALQSLETPLDPPAPPAIVLSADQLAAYTGTYAAAPRVAVRVMLAAGHLVESANGGPAVPIVPEAPDFFVPANAPRTTLLFRRDTGGRITSLASRYEGRDTLFARRPA